VPRFYAFAIALTGVLCALPWTLAVYRQKQNTPTAAPTHHVIVVAAASMVAAALVAALVWSLLLALRRRAIARPVAKAAAGVLIALAVVAPFVAVSDPIGSLKARYHDFKALKVSEGSASRFTDAGGFRYDLWRIAWADFKSEPLHGLGAGNYGLSYFKQRATTEPVRQPHSIELQLLAETGLPGLALFVVFAAGAGIGFARLSRDRRPQASLVAAAGGGLASVWLVHTSVDWLHEIPGLTGMAMIAFAALCAGSESVKARSERVRRGTLVGILALAALAAAGIGRHYAATVKAEQAQHEVASDPRAALRSSASSLKIDDTDVDVYVSRAAAFARLGDAVDADATLAVAIRREPSNYVLRALRGDLAARRGRLADARTYYRQALDRNPRDASLSLLVAHPGSAVAG
jgi:tetratricopeptide (TPR) repeat protein